MWNRSSALTFEELALFNTVMNAAIEGALERLAIVMSPDELKTVVDNVSAAARELIEERLFPEMAAYEKRRQS